MIFKGEERGACFSQNYICGFLEPYYLNIPSNPNREKIKISMFARTLINDIVIYVRLGERFTEKPTDDPYDSSIKDYFVVTHRDIMKSTTIFEDESNEARACYRGPINILITSIRKWGGSNGIVSVLEL